MIYLHYQDDKQEPDWQLVTKTCFGIGILSRLPANLTEIHLAFNRYAVVLVSLGVLGLRQIALHLIERFITAADALAQNFDFLGRAIALACSVSYFCQSSKSASTQ